MLKNLIYNTGWDAVATIPGVCCSVVTADGPGDQRGYPDLGGEKKRPEIAAWRGITAII